MGQQTALLLGKEDHAPKERNQNNDNNEKKEQTAHGKEMADAMGLGLSLRLQPAVTHTQLQENKDKKEETASYEKQASKSELVGVTSHMSPPGISRKARVSVRARCQAPTVS